MDPKDFKGISNESARALLLERIREGREERANPDESMDRGPLAAFFAGLRRGLLMAFRRFDQIGLELDLTVGFQR